MAKWIILDSNFLLWRAFHSGAGGLENGATYGFLRDIATLEEQFSPAITIFAFDAGGSKRAEIYPEYKANRKPLDQTEEEKAERAEFYEQIRVLPKRLRAMGYKNIFGQKGYEADDIIATITGNMPTRVLATIVSADKDLWQLLHSGAECYNPITKQTMTTAKFTKEWRLAPCQYASIKAFAGCTTDNVIGIKGIGEKKAAAWFRNELKPDSVAYKAIDSNLEIFNRNIKVVRLPFEGCETRPIRPDETTPDKKEAVYKELGFPLLEKRRPRGVKPRGDSAGFGFSGP